MSDLASRLQAIEDRIAIEQVLLDYYRAVDSLSDLDGLVACFTPDAVFDVTKLGLTCYVGQDQIRGFFAGVFADTIHHAHHISNFRISRLAGDEATAHGYVFARAENRAGFKVSVHCWYDMELVRTTAGWKLRRFDEGALIPLGDEVATLHAQT